MQVHPHLTLGPLHVDDVTVRVLVQTSGPPDISVEAAATVGGTLGPLDFFVRGIGLRAGVMLSKGNLGPLDLQIGFLPPTGVGLSVEVAGFSGGGFLILDAAKGEYAGGLELDFQGLVTVKALGVLNTRFSDGHRGFSLVLIILAEFPPVQLGFGFTLVGVGGLLGLNRTMDEDALREGIHQGALDSVLFPTNLVANAPRLVNDLRRLFPPFEDHFLVGPMVKFGWGTPTILSLEFGFLLEIPRPAFTIIGRLRIGLPFQDLPLWDVRVTFAGGLTATEKDAGESYWRARASANAVADAAVREGAVQGAWNLLATRYGAYRASWIARATTPTNWVRSWSTPATLVFPTLTVKPLAWSDTPRSPVLPDRFAVILERGTASRTVSASPSQTTCRWAPIRSRATRSSRETPPRGASRSRTSSCG